MKTDKGDKYFNVNSAPVAGGNMWLYYKVDVDGEIRLSCHTKAALAKRQATFLAKPEHEQKATQEQRMATRAAREATYGSYHDVKHGPARQARRTAFAKSTESARLPRGVF